MQETPGYVYVLSNPAMPNVVKIGRSINGGASRAKQIYQTGVPEPFNLEFEIFTSYSVYLEMVVHERLEADRVSSSREFFRIPVWEAIEAVMDVAAGLFDLTAQRFDTIVMPEDVNWMTHEVSKIGLDVIPPEIASAFRFIDPAAVAEAVRKWLVFIESKRATRDPE